MTTTEIRLALAQPQAVTEPDGEANVARATELVARAAARGASLVLLPESYPGPLLHRPYDTYDAAPAMRAAAMTSEVNLCWSRVELCDDEVRRLVVYVVDPGGETLIRYPRAHPAAIDPAETKGQWTAPGEEGLGLVEIDGIRVGIVVCSELWIPEPTRALALQGAELVLSPAGGGFTSLTDNWQAVARARAIENLMYVGLTNNIWNGEQGAAMIAGPEHIAASSGYEDLVFADLDLERVRWLRSHDDSIIEPKPFSSIPGLTRFRRPELYDALTRTDTSDYDFFTDRSAAGADDR